MSNPIETSPNPVRSNHPPERVKAPLVGIVALVALAGGLGVWTMQRISSAKATAAEVATRRVEDSQRAAAVAKAPPIVEVTRGSAAEWQPRVELDGTLEADQSARLAFRVPGKLSSVGARVGDVVKAGHLLATLDANEVRAQLAAAEAQVRATEAQLALATDNERRTLSLVQTGATAEALGVQTEKQKQLALAQLDAAKAQQTLAKTSLSNHTLVAPFGGTVTRAPSGIGSIVSPSEALFEVVNTSLLKLATTVTESDAGLLVPGAAVTITTETGEATGQVRALLATLDAQTRRVPVLAEFKNPGTLRAGSFVSAWVNSQEKLDVVRIPHTVVRPGSQDEVLVVDPASGAISVRRLTFAVDKDGSLLVRRGITVSDVLVVNPNAETKAGDVVQVKGNATP
jgi:RND family efflux transporter MFP subunit